MLLFFLFPHATAPVAVALKQTVDVDNEEVVEELDTKKSFGSLDLKNYETYNRGEGFQLFARKIRQERSKGNHFLVLIYYYLFTI